MLRREASWPTLVRSCLLLALLTGLPACSDDDPDPNAPEPPVEQRGIVQCTDYARGRFFRLTAPVSFYFTDPALYPQPLRDDSFDYVVSAESPAAPLEIDYASLKVYRSFGGFGAPGDTLFDAIAYLDSTGIGFEGFGAGAGLTPGDSGKDGTYPDSGFDPSLAFAGVPHQYRELWEPLQTGRDWQLTQADGAVLGIQLTRGLADTEVLAVSYDIVDGSSGAVVRRAGRSAEDGEASRIEDPASPGRQVHYFKLLKPGAPLEQPFDGGEYSEFALTWEYEYRNVYHLYLRDVSPADFEFVVVATDSTVDPPDREPVTKVRFLRIFGLDQLSRTGVAVPDGLADVENPDIFDLEAGLLRFPHPTPMNLPDSVVAHYTDGVLLSVPAGARMPELYTRLLTVEELRALRLFEFRYEWLE